MGGWLSLTQPGLSPGKKRQASLGALMGGTLAKTASAIIDHAIDFGKPQPEYSEWVEFGKEEGVII